VRRRGLLLGVTLLAVVAGTAGAAPPEGPRLVLTEYQGFTDTFVLKTVGADGAAPIRLVEGGKSKRPVPAPLEAPGWSADGSMIVFAGTGGRVAGTKGFVVEDSQVFVVAADGTGLLAIPGTTGAINPVFAPDNRTVAFARQRRRTRPNDRGGVDVVDRRTAIWLIDIHTGASSRITPWRSWLNNYPSSFSPDGSTLLAARFTRPDGPPSLVALPLDGARGAVLARRATLGVYSPDGSRIAFLRPRVRRLAGRGGKPEFESTTDLYAMSSDGTAERQLTRTAAGIELWPSWDPSGERIAYTRLRGGSFLGFLGFGDTVMQVNADGSCVSTILRGRRGFAYWGGAWQPGPGREAGRIAC
jgi:Tol biopolymer transport system component